MPFHEAWHMWPRSGPPLVSKPGEESGLWFGVKLATASISFQTEP